MSDPERALFAESDGVAFRQYVGKTNPDNPSFTYNHADVTLYYDWYGVVFSTSESAKATFDVWAKWISESGNQFDGIDRAKFPISIYDSHQYEMISPHRNDSGQFDMKASWNLNAEGERGYVGGLHLLQTGSMITIFWLHADKPDKCHVTYISSEIMNALYPSISSSAPQGPTGISEDTLLGLLPATDAFSFDPSMIASVSVGKEWAVGNE
jgi:hypothetical protein